MKKNDAVCLKHDLLVFSHLRWNFVFQRPQHLMTRFAQHRRVYFIEECLVENIYEAYLSLEEEAPDLFVAVPHVPPHLSHTQQSAIVRKLLDEMIQGENIDRYNCWYYTPMALHYSDHLTADVVIYDCMDELANFKAAPKEIIEKERSLLERADVVFTGGHSLYEEKRKKHDNVHAFPSAIDREHFWNARSKLIEPEDQECIPHPRLGFAGVIDERMDISLLEKMARLRPDWHFVLLGPIVKISPESLPKLDNIHYLGMKRYTDLPSYMSSWDCALMPFAKNESTHFISPTKTPEYLSAGLPVISTSIRDVVSTYGERSLVAIADTAEEFVAAAEKILRNDRDPQQLDAIDSFLKTISWDYTWEEMSALEAKALQQRGDLCL
ncbi:glycosyltransferase family 1 protein [Bdellovibrio sp. HCB2-146]|uniref:glycosyltransferase family 1 protein n=1 Tax=Bdellovibrio sp. HCB2-146 TaxID=3394362 RepID=UPI0039BC4C0F